MKNNQIIIAVILAVVLGAGGFFAGMKYQQGKQTTPAGQFGGRQGGNGAVGQQNGMRAGGGQVLGEVISQDDKSITVKLQDGSSKIVLFSDTTTISKTTEGSKSDLKVGERVMVFGTSNSDGSVTAQSIQLNPRIGGIIPTANPSKP